VLVVFRDLIRWFTILFTGHSDYSAAGHAVNPNVPWLGIYFVMLTPVVGGLIYGPLIQRFAPEARGHGVPEVMLAVAERGGRIRPQVAVVKSLASAICIGAGGSVGREGADRGQIGSALGALRLGQVLHVSETRLRPPRRLRDRRRYLGNVQRTHRRRSSRPRAHPPGLRRRFVRRRGAGVSHG